MQNKKLVFVTKSIQFICVILLAILPSLNFGSNKMYIFWV